MARRSVPPPKPRSPILTVGQKRRRTERLHRLNRDNLRCMTGDHDEDDRPDQTKANADGMDHAVRDDLAAIVIPRDPCRPPVIHRHPCNHEDQSPISAVVGFAVASNEDTR
jgi:hypothetical protein